MEIDTGILMIVIYVAIFLNLSFYILNRSFNI